MDKTIMCLQPKANQIHGSTAKIIFVFFIQKGLGQIQLKRAYCFWLKNEIDDFAKINKNCQFSKIFIQWYEQVYKKKKLFHC